MVFGVAFIVLFYVLKCSTLSEIKTYISSKDNVYYYGTKVCPAAWQLRGVKINGIKNLPKDKKIEIVSAKENNEISKILSENFLGYNKFIAGEGDRSFIIYETICKACELK